MRLLHRTLRVSRPGHLHIGCLGMMIIIVLVVALVIATSDIHHPDWGAFFAPIREALHIIGTTLRAWWQTLVAWVTATPKAT